MSLIQPQGKGPDNGQQVVLSRYSARPMGKYDSFDYLEC